VLAIEKNVNPGLYPSWSPDGKRIAYVGPQRTAIELFDVVSAKVTTFASFADRIFFEIHWLADGRGLAVRYSGTTTHFHAQIGYISYPDAAFHAITRDTNQYSTLTLSSDGKMLATVQAKTTRTPYLFPASGSPESSPAEAPLQIPEIFSLNWASNGGLLVGNATNLFRVSRDGSNQTTLLSDSTGLIYAASACGNDHIVLTWVGHNSTNGVSIWRINSDGSDAQELMKNTGLVTNLMCSPDGRIVYFYANGTYRIMEVPIEGGKVEIVPGTVIPNEFVAFPVLGLSPDGKLMPFFSESTPGHLTLNIVALNAGPNPPVRKLTPDPRVSGAVEFTPDGKAVAYSITENGVANVWVQPLDGSKGRQITHFISGTIAAGSWSPEGKTLALLRTQTQSDIVLLRESAAQ
jgi:eukaryotic-like serine/threonine-protein kinase